MESPSIRSLSSLLLLPPPKQGCEAFHTPWASPDKVEESRDEEDIRLQYNGDDQHQYSTVKDMGNRTPPKMSNNLAVGYTSERRKSYFGSPTRQTEKVYCTPPEPEKCPRILSEQSPTDCSGVQSSILQIKSSSHPDEQIFMVGTTKFYSRTLIPPTIYHNASTDLWVVTVNNNNITSSINYASNTNNSCMKAFSFRSEKEARASAHANAPPVMRAFDRWKACMLCGTQFTIFKRPRHCRNCGICICSNFGCCTYWPKSMIPETFNIKNEIIVKICTSCDTLSKRFRHALLQGQYKTAVDLYLTGNINLRVPFAFKGRGNAEISFPIHCAIEGMSERLVRWLVDVQHCPIHVISTGNTKRSSIMSVAGIKSLAMANEKRPDFVPTLKTSKGRSILDIAMKTQHVGILRYLINEKNVCVYEVDDLDLALGAVEALSKAFQVPEQSREPEAVKIKPNEFLSAGSGTIKVESVKNRSEQDNHLINCSPKKARTRSPLLQKSYGEQIAGMYGAIGGFHGNIDSDDDEGDSGFSDDDASVCTTIPDVCMLCHQKDVNCVAMPCGHQICCLTCSRQRLICPQCNSNCHFIALFQP